jgi:hypothetical protein
MRQKSGRGFVMLVISGGMAATQSQSTSRQRRQGTLAQAMTTQRHDDSYR